MPLNPLVSVLVCAGLCTAPSFAMDSRWTQGLRLSWEALPGDTAFNGMSFRVQRATGLDVPVLAQRIAADWQRESGGEGLKLMRHGEWSILSRIHDGRSEVVQWRERSEDAELLWSEADLRLEPQPSLAARYLVSACNWLPPISGSATGGRFRQFTGYCASRSAAVGDALASALQLEGWRTRRNASGLMAERKGDRFEAVISPQRLPAGKGHTTEGTAVVVLEATSSARTPW
jgi:hypothetical protein